MSENNARYYDKASTDPCHTCYALLRDVLHMEIIYSVNNLQLEIYMHMA
jgi:hypothetical protein